MTKVLYSAVLYDYGIKNNGPGYEHFNLELGLKDFCAAKEWDFIAFNPDKYPEKSRFERLKEEIVEFQPDYLFSVNFNDSHDVPREAADILHTLGGKLIEFHCDPVRRFLELSKRKRFVDWFITTDERTLGWYENLQMKVINSQYAVSSIYKTLNTERDIDVSFVGQSYGWRKDAIRILQKNGVDVQVFGKFWNKEDDSEMISFDKVLNILSRSKICISFLGSFPGTAAPDQLKARVFEATAMGGCLVTTPSFNIDNYFIDKKEIFVCDKMTIMADTVKELLSNNNKRMEVAKAGKERTLTEHTWEKRFESIFSQIEKPNG